MNRVLALLVLAFAAIGCGKPGVTIKGENGESVNVNGSSTTVTGKDGEKIEVKSDQNGVTATSSNGAKTQIDANGIKGTDEKGNSFEAGTASVAESDLGFPFYPGSTESPNGSMKSKTAEGTTYLCTRTTPDDPQKVTAFYKGKLTDSNTLNMSSSMDGSQITGKVGDKTDVVVSATREKDSPVTRIVLSVNQRAK